MFLALFGAYVGQPDGHIGWVTLMPFASINPTNPRTNLWNFGENCSAFGGGWKTQFFWVGHFEFWSLNQALPVLSFVHSYSTVWAMVHNIILYSDMISYKNWEILDSKRVSFSKEKSNLSSDILRRAQNLKKSSTLYLALLSNVKF